MTLFFEELQRGFVAPDSVPLSAIFVDVDLIALRLGRARSTGSRLVQVLCAGTLGTRTITGRTSLSREVGFDAGFEDLDDTTIVDLLRK